MALECDGPDRVTKADCPLHGPLRHGVEPVNGPASALDQVDWAGLPVNLDLVFSRSQRDKVYVQHLMRKRGSRLWRWLHDGAQTCACEATEDPNLHPDSAKDYV